jgi:hypothetical protein
MGWLYWQVKTRLGLLFFPNRANKLIRRAMIESRTSANAGNLYEKLSVVFGQNGEGALAMERDLLVMIYGAIMGVVGSIVTSIVTALVHFWLERREYQRRQSEEHERQLRRIHLPTDEEILLINSDRENQHQPPEAARTLAEIGSILLSIILSSTAVYQTRDPMLGFAFGACLGFLMMRRITRFFTR